MICHYCKIKFDQIYNNQKYCSKKCRDTYWYKIYYQKNKNKCISNARKWEEKTQYRKTQKCKNRVNKYLKNRRKTDFIFKLKQNIKERLYHDGYKNIGNIEEKLGYKLKDLKKYLLNKSNFKEKDYLDGKIHIDHIIQYNWYLVLEVGDLEFKKCWNMKNLRLIEKSKNLSRKRKSFNWYDIKKYNLENILPCGADIIYKLNRNKEISCQLFDLDLEE